MHATEFLEQAPPDKVPPFVVLLGGEHYLKQLVIQRIAEALFGAEDAQEMLNSVEGKTANWTSIADELRTISMFGGNRCVLIDGADDFVSSFRSQLETYADHPAKSGVLILDVKSWPKTTKLAKKIVKTSLLIDCGELKGAQLTSWICGTAKSKYGKTISRNAAQTMTELAGTSIGLLAQEIDKLVSFVGERNQITEEDVQTLVGGWRLETTWAMINGVRDGQLGQALTELNKLIVAGEAPQKLLGGITFVYRKIIQAVRISAQTRQLGPALKDAGVFPRDIPATETYLRRLGRVRAEQIPRLLSDVDMALKGESALPPRVLIEKLLVELSP